VAPGALRANLARQSGSLNRLANPSRYFVASDDARAGLDF